MSKIVKTVDRGLRIVADVEVQVTELLWTDGGHSFEVHRVDTGEDLTEDGCFDDPPTDEQIEDLLDPPIDGGPAAVAAPVLTPPSPIWSSTTFVTATWSTAPAIPYQPSRDPHDTAAGVVQLRRSADQLRPATAAGRRATAAVSRRRRRSKPTTSTSTCSGPTAGRRPPPPPPMPAPSKSPTAAAHHRI